MREQRGVRRADRAPGLSPDASQGLLVEQARAALEDESMKRIVLAQETQVRQNGVSGVPDFLVNKRLFVVGAQTTVDFVKVFDRVMFGEDSDLEMSDSLH